MIGIDEVNQIASGRDGKKSHNVSQTRRKKRDIRREIGHQLATLKTKKSKKHFLKE